MDILEIIKKRRSIREFEDRAVPEEVMDDLVEALRWAPSAGNLQSRFFYFVLNPALREELAEAAYAQDFIARAPLVVVACADRRIAHTYGRRGMELYMIQDASASAQNLLLAAHARGLGAVWVGSFDEERVRFLLDIPDDLLPVALVPIGWPAERPLPRSRFPRDQMVKVLR